LKVYILRHQEGDYTKIENVYKDELKALKALKKKREENTLSKDFADYFVDSHRVIE